MPEILRDMITYLAAIPRITEKIKNFIFFVSRSESFEIT